MSKHKSYNDTHLTLHLPRRLPAWINDSLFGSGNGDVAFGQHGYEERNGKFWNDTTLAKAAADQKCRVFQLDLRTFDLGRIRYANCESVADITHHCRRIVLADLTKPVIFDDWGHLVDGYHRVSKALIVGRTRIPAVRLRYMPDPDEKREPAEN